MKMFKFFAFLMAFAVAFTACNDDDNGDEGPDQPLVEDGIYLIAEGSAVSEPSSKGKLTNAVNENDADTDRPSLMEIYMPIEGGTSFTIKEVSGASTMNYGSGDIALVDKTAEGENADQPAANFWRGTLTDGGTAISVSESGMYHIFLDKETMNVGLTKVSWGAIGAAMPGGWNTSEQFMESEFNKEIMTWTYSDIAVKKGDWKLRYSQAWKAFLDYTTVTSDGKEGVAINCNLGGAADALVGGGGNIANDEAAYFDMTLTWELGKGYTLEMVKGDILEPTNWTNLPWDAIGEGVSVDNASSIETPAEDWGGWGRTLDADNNGLPTVVGNKYTYTWTNIVLEAESGFKVRQAKGVGLGLGKESVNYDSSSELVEEGDGDITVSEKGTFNITLTITAEPGEDIVDLIIADAVL